MITRAEATQRILAAKEAKGLSFQKIAEQVGQHPVWVTSAVLGQQQMTAEQARAVGDALDVDQEVVAALQAFPTKGSLDQTVPVDPLIYRFYEIMQVYGTTLKALIHEEFGDGIMSAIDFQMDIQRKADPKGDRVVVTMDGKFLPYRTW
jgi:cyanate lyase